LLRAPDRAQALTHRQHRGTHQQPGQRGYRRADGIEADAGEYVATERREVEDAIAAAQRARAERTPAVNPVRIDDVLAKGRHDQDGQDPRKGAPGGPRRQTGGNEQAVGRVIEEPPGGGRHSATSGDRPVEHVGGDPHEQNERGQECRWPVVPKHQQRERYGEQDTRAGQRVRHGVRASQVGDILRLDAVAGARYGRAGS